MRKRTLTITDIPGLDWLPVPTDKYSIAANLALAGLEDFEGYLSAKTQRAVFGRYIFGRKFIAIHEHGNKITVSKKVCFGTDSIGGTFTLDQIAEFLKNPAKLQRYF